uniref:THAP-type domain-containing protein n=1 Tax=Amphimedon queenslandica TaxID=400682 RepID=A0A1X7V1H4_AMPQE
MVHDCCVPGCSNNSTREAHLSFFSLPLKRKSLLKQWVHAIGRKNLQLNKHTRICSEHFIQANGRLLRKD